MHLATSYYLFAQLILRQLKSTLFPYTTLFRSSVEDVLAGTNDILAEWISDEASYREHIRSATWKKGKIETEAKDSSLDEKEVYKMYYEYSEPINTLVSHRILAINRGEKEGVLKIGRAHV